MRPARTGVALATLLLLAGCATAPALVAGTPAPTPTAACPQLEGVELPPECAPYDPEYSMAQNDRYRDRMDVDADAHAQSAELVPEVARALEAVRARGHVTAASVAEELEAVGLVAPRVRDDYGRVLFGANGPRVAASSARCRPTR